MRIRRTRNAVGAVLAGAALMAMASPAIAGAQSSRSSDPAPVAIQDVKSVSPDAKSVVAAAQYGIRNLKSEKFLQPSGGSTANGAKIVQQPFNASSLTQLWTRVPDGSYLSFENYSGKNLGIDGASTAAGAAAIQANPSSDVNQDWVQIARNDSVFELKNRKSGLCLGISGASTANGAQAAQFACDGSANQGWEYFQ
ncbi:RICIN domain-containing protein [Streptomyces sp. NPDC059092]|uniref:RICIN domain-containing protein n=1 Tax=Streptomyces sp. NPDC059092 TaxID=3346725 RepID=UPI0036B9ABEF